MPEYSEVYDSISGLQDLIKQQQHLLNIINLRVAERRCSTGMNKDYVNLYKFMGDFNYKLNELHRCTEELQKKLNKIDEF